MALCTSAQCRGTQAHSADFCAERRGESGGEGDSEPDDAAANESPRTKSEDSEHGSSASEESKEQFLNGTRASLSDILWQMTRLQGAPMATLYDATASRRIVTVTIATVSTSDSHARHIARAGSTASWVVVKTQPHIYLVYSARRRKKSCTVNGDAKRTARAIVSFPTCEPLMNGARAARWRYLKRTCSYPVSSSGTWSTGPPRSTGSSTRGRNCRMREIQCWSHTTKCTKPWHATRTASVATKKAIFWIDPREMSADGVFAKIAGCVRSRRDIVRLAGNVSERRWGMFVQTDGTLRRKMTALDIKGNMDNTRIGLSLKSQNMTG